MRACLNISCMKNYRLLLIAATLVLLCGCKENENKINGQEQSSQAPDIVIENSATDIQNEMTMGDEASDESVPGIEISIAQDDDALAETENVDVDARNSRFPDTYVYYDVFRNAYEMDVNRGVRENLYDSGKFTYLGAEPDASLFIGNNPVNPLGGGEQLMGYDGIIKYEDDRYTSRFGIDVSKFQGNINWEKVKEAGVTFVIVRVGFRGYGSSGSLSEDAMYRKNLEGARAAGLDTGVYFYAQAINEAEAVEEAEYVLKLIDGYDLNMPVVYDPEHVLNDDARTDNVTGEQFTKNTKAFCDRIREAGYTPMIYANMLWQAKEFDMSELSDVELWHADYELKPQTPYYFTMWQYSQGGHIPGISGAVDLNIQIYEK